MEISPALLGQWQHLAIEGTLRALDPRQKETQPLVNRRLSRLTYQTAARFSEARAEGRLET